MTPEDFPWTVEAVMALRAAHGFVSPVRPVTPGRPWCCLVSRGSYEWLMHPVDAIHHLAHGLRIDGRVLSCRLTSTPLYPFMGAVQIEAIDHTLNVGFIEASLV